MGSAADVRDTDTNHHIVRRDAVDGNIVRVKIIKSEEQHTDVPTKAFDVKTFEKHREFLLSIRVS